jgi:hypothetical protein
MQRVDLLPLHHTEKKAAIALAAAAFLPIEKIFEIFLTFKKEFKEKFRIYI